MRFARNSWFAIPAAAMAILVAAIFRPELRALFGTDVPAAPAPELTAEPEPTPTASPAPESSAEPAPSPAPPPPPEPPPVTPPPAEPRPTAIDGKDAKTWRTIMRGAVMRHDARVAADAFVALAKMDPGRFADRNTMHDAATAAHLAASATEAIGDRVFTVLAGDALGHHACDILYRITSIHGGSRAAKRAKVLLLDPKVLARGTKAMRIALTVRDTPCKSRPALFEESAKAGDLRTLYLLQAMKGAHCSQISCCMHGNTDLDTAIGAIRTRLAASR